MSPKTWGRAGSGSSLITSHCIDRRLFHIRLPSSEPAPTLNVDGPRVDDSRRPSDTDERARIKQPSIDRHAYPLYPSAASPALIPLLVPICHPPSAVISLRVASHQRAQSALSTRADTTPRRSVHARLQKVVPRASYAELSLQRRHLSSSRYTTIPPSQSACYFHKPHDPRGQTELLPELRDHGGTAAYRTWPPTLHWTVQRAREDHLEGPEMVSWIPESRRRTLLSSLQGRAMTSGCSSDTNSHLLQDESICNNERKRSGMPQGRPSIYAEALKRETRSMLIHTIKQRYGRPQPQETEGQRDQPRSCAVAKRHLLAYRYHMPTQDTKRNVRPRWCRDTARGS
ncbi:hypothetical protein BV25DRAFT_1824960 [Artomyces pyxidatus]|uniref:Uncharacterized protein n=1 Tax=Artomyces pyxidatus TaxID=48021 RepID=A0ACB8T443_9AGAM|nr:hypothetical protein BV25DRAFT_1824960 [Artomyces pyxidatus]